MYELQCTIIRCKKKRWCVLVMAHIIRFYLESQTKVCSAHMRLYSGTDLCVHCLGDRFLVWNSKVKNCVTEIKDMLCKKYIKTLCYIKNIETSCAKCTNIMHEIHKC